MYSPIVSHYLSFPRQNGRRCNNFQSISHGVSSVFFWIKNRAPRNVISVFADCSMCQPVWRLITSNLIIYVVEVAQNVWKLY